MAQDCEITLTTDELAALLDVHKSAVKAELAALRSNSHGAELTPEDAARLLGVPVAGLRAHHKRWGLPSFRTEKNRLRFDRSEIEAWADANQAKLKKLRGEEPAAAVLSAPPVVRSTMTVKEATDLAAGDLFVAAILRAAVRTEADDYRGATRHSTYALGGGKEFQACAPEIVHICWLHGLNIDEQSVPARIGRARGALADLGVTVREIAPRVPAGYRRIRVRTWEFTTDGRYENEENDHEQSASEAPAPAVIAA